jgi:hypothetical protein
MLSSNRSSPGGRLPNFIIVGATKAGTTSLDFYLSLHPEIHMARPKEPRFFIDAQEPFGRWQRGLSWYRSLFVSDKALCGEASPTYASWSAKHGVFERMQSLVPHAKILFVVREHFARLWSSYLMNVRYHGTEDSLSEFLLNNQWALDGSLYGARVENILRHFPHEQLLVLEAQELQEHRAETLCKVFQFLGADREFHSPLFQHKRHESRFHAYPNKVGRKVLRHPAMRMLEQKLPPSLFYHLRNGLNVVLAGNKPELSLDSELREDLSRTFAQDSLKLRDLTGLALPSLDVPHTQP